MATSAMTPHEVSTIMHVRCPDGLPEAAYRQVLELLAELSPVVQAVPPTVALVELKGALRYLPHWPYVTVPSTPRTPHEDPARLGTGTTAPPATAAA